MKSRPFSHSVQFKWPKEYVWITMKMSEFNSQSMDRHKGLSLLIIGLCRHQMKCAFSLKRREKVVGTREIEWKRNESKSANGGKRSEWFKATVDCIPRTAYKYLCSCVTHDRKLNICWHRHLRRSGLSFCRICRCRRYIKMIVEPKPKKAIEINFITYFVMNIGSLSAMW